LGLITCWSCIAAVNFSYALSRPRGRQRPHTSAGRQAALCDLEAVGLARRQGDDDEDEGPIVPPPAGWVQGTPTCSEGQHIQKTLEDAGIKLDSVAADVLGASGRAMLAALVAGERDPGVLAELAKGRLRAKLPQLRQALRGRFRGHHALLVRLALAHLEQLEGSIAQLDAQVDRVLVPFAQARDRLDTITGGKRHSGTTTKGNRWLGEVLIECAWAAARSRDTYLAAQYWRLARRIGKKRAAIAVGHSIS